MFISQSLNRMINLSVKESIPIIIINTCKLINNSKSFSAFKECVVVQCTQFPLQPNWAISMSAVITDGATGASVCVRARG